ncbi:MAG: hypothetical protein ABGZ53_28445, partial [Fuerstiella sp.]
CGPIGVVADRLFEVVSHLGLTDGSNTLPIWRATRLTCGVTEGSPERKGNVTRYGTQQPNLNVSLPFPNYPVVTIL